MPLAHVEAGLRSHNRRMPEEVNRICADHLSNCRDHSTSAARENLRREGLLERGRALGDVTYDAVRLFSALEPGPELAALPEIEGPFVLATLHRAEMTDEPGLLARVWSRLQESRLACPLPDPPADAGRRRARRTCGGPASSPRRSGGRPGHAPAASRRCSLLVTDSGGLQKEAYFTGTPCLTLRRETEWTETVASGWNRLDDLDGCPPIDAEREGARRGSVIEEYGDGHAAEKIVRDLCGPSDGGRAATGPT